LASIGGTNEGNAGLSELFWRVAIVQTAKHQDDFRLRTSAGLGVLLGDILRGGLAMTGLSFVPVFFNVATLCRKASIRLIT
jgi:hypothetical protein